MIRFLQTEPIFLKKIKRPTRVNSIVLLTKVLLLKFKGPTRVNSNVLLQLNVQTEVVTVTSHVLLES